MVSQAIGVRNAKNRPFVLRKGVSVLSDLADGGAVYGYPGDYYGQIYFVNNITGNSAYDGLSWDTPFAQPSEAITASEAFRALPSGTTNDYQRNRIFIQGTGTAYSPISALPSYCDMIGIGANPRGNGAGIARIVSNTDSEDAISHGSSGVRGLYMENIQAGADSGSSTGWALDLAKIFRSEFVNCVFWNKETGGVRVTIGGGVAFRACLLGGGDTRYPTTGFSNDGLANFNHCVIEDSYIYGETTGLILSAVAMGQTLIQRNMIYGGSIGIDDNQDNKDFYDLPQFLDNRIFVDSGGDCIDSLNNGTEKAIGNMCNTAGTITWEGSIS